MLKQIILLECSYSLYVIVTIIGYPILIVFSVLRGLYRCLKTKFESAKSIAGEVALITGSGRGLGRAVAIELAKLGCHLAIVDIQGKLAVETAEYIAETYGVKTKAYTSDITDFQQLLDLRTKVTKDLGDVTVLINNAGIITLSSFENPPPEEVQRMVNVNFIATIFTTQIFLPKMKQLNRGHIVNISSLSALVPCHLYAVYGASKSAVRHFTSSLRIELMQSNCNITATTIMPTFVNTNDRINQLMRATGGHIFVPGISGDVVARYVVNGMMRGDDEVTVPRVFLYQHKFIGLFTTYIMETVIRLATKSFWKKRDSAEVQKFLKLDDIQRDL